jgi:hypothetical protein
VQVKACFAFLVNPFLVDVINDGCPILKMLRTETSATEMGRMEIQGDQGQQMVHKFQSTIKLWKMVPEVKLPRLKKFSCRLIQFC